jgi:hypothetical protein
VGCGAEGRDGDADSAGGELMEMTLDQWGLAIVAASKKVGKEKRASFQELLHALRTPVGGLGRGRKD